MDASAVGGHAGILSSASAATVFERLARPRGVVTESAPALTFADVVMLLQPETYIPDGKVPYRHALRHASFAALAVTARVGSAQASRLLESAWRPQGEDVLALGAPPFRPTIPLLPLTVSIVEDYRSQRRQAHEPWLFVTDSGKCLRPGAFRDPFGKLGRRLGIASENLVRRLHEFFDRCLDGESDRAAVIVLRGIRQGALGDKVWKSEIAAAAADRDRLRRVLERNHPLAGPAGRHRGERARQIVRAGAHKLHFQPLRLSPLLDSDPVLLALRSEKWPAPGERGFQRCLSLLREKYFGHVDGLWCSGLITPSDAAFLFKCKKGTLHRWRREERARTAGARERTREMRLRGIAVAAFREHGADGGLVAFLREFNRENDCDKQLGWLSLVLVQAGLARRRPGRPRRRGARRNRSAR